MARQAHGVEGLRITAGRLFISEELCHSPGGADGERGCYRGEGGAVIGLVIMIITSKVTTTSQGQVSSSRLTPSRARTFALLLRGSKTRVCGVLAAGRSMLHFS